MIWAVADSPAVSLALNALTRCELQRAAAFVLPTCNGLLEWRRWPSHRGCELPETPTFPQLEDARVETGVVANISFQLGMATFNWLEP